jgi:hypothetical protein
MKNAFAHGPPMIVISEFRGQLGNRLFLSAYGVALAEATNQRLLDWSLHEYADLFPATRSKVPLTVRSAVRKCFRALVHGIKRVPFMQSSFVPVGWRVTDCYSPSDSAFVKSLMKRRLTFIEGFPDPARIEFPSQAAIRTKFAPATSITEEARAFALQARSGSDVLIGLHVRHGDYRHHYGGRYYYPMDFYLKVVKALNGLLPGRKIAVALCSNASHDFTGQEPFKITRGPGTLLGDLYSLAECDYIVGAPSTYSLWAAFHGRKPLLHLHEARLPESLEEFMVPDGHFECIDLRLPLEEQHRLQAANDEFFRQRKRGLA